MLFKIVQNAPITHSRLTATPSYLRGDLQVINLLVNLPRVINRLQALDRKSTLGKLKDIPLLAT